MPVVVYGQWCREGEAEWWVIFAAISRVLPKQIKLLEQCVGPKKTIGLTHALVLIDSLFP